MRRRLKYLRATARAILSITVNTLLALQYIETLRINLRGAFFPQQHIRPRDVVLPVLYVQILIFVIASQLHSELAITFGTIGNLILVGLAILPSTFKKI